MTPEQAAAALASGRTSRPDRQSDEERKRRVKAASNAGHKARTALARLHRDDYDALYRVALEQELAK